LGWPASDDKNEATTKKGAATATANGNNNKNETRKTITKTTGDFIPFFGWHRPDPVSKPFPGGDGLIFQILQAVTPRLPEVLLRRSDDGTTVQNHIVE